VKKCLDHEHATRSEPSQDCHILIRDLNRISITGGQAHDKTSFKPVNTHLWQWIASRLLAIQVIQVQSRCMVACHAKLCKTTFSSTACTLPLTYIKKQHFQSLLEYAYLCTKTSWHSVRSPVKPYKQVSGYPSKNRN
jgi:hypothetical protein